MSKAIVAITTTFNGSRRFVSATFHRPDHLIAVELSEKQIDAHDFKSMQLAREICKQIFNPFNRNYSVELLSLQSSGTTVTRTSTWLEDKIFK